MLKYDKEEVLKGMWGSFFLNLGETHFLYYDESS
jgi:hypothetical protein